MDTRACPESTGLEKAVLAGVGWGPGQPPLWLQDGGRVPGGWARSGYLYSGLSVPSCLSVCPSVYRSASLCDSAAVPARLCLLSS